MIKHLSRFTLGLLTILFLTLIVSGSTIVRDGGLSSLDSNVTVTGTFTAPNVCYTNGSNCNTNASAIATLYYNKTFIDNIQNNYLRNDANGVLNASLIIEGNLTVIGTQIIANATTANYNGSIVPDLDDTFDIGNSTLHWREGHFLDLFGNLNSSYITNPTWIANNTASVLVLGFNTTSQLNGLYYDIDNPVGYINDSIHTLVNFYNKTDADARYMLLNSQVYNYSSTIASINTTQNIMSLGFYNSTYLNQYLIGGGARIYWFDNQSITGGFRNMSLSPPTTATSTISVPIATSEISLATFITPLATGQTVFAGGIRNVYISTYSLDTNREVQLQAIVSRCANYNLSTGNCDGGIIGFANSTTTICDMTVPDTHKLTYFVNSTYLLNATDRFLVNITATKISGGSTTFNLVVGDNSLSRIEVPSPVGVTDISALQTSVNTINSGISGIQSNLTAINETIASFNPSTFTGIQNNLTAVNNSLSNYALTTTTSGIQSNLTSVNDSIVMRQSTTGNTIGAVTNILDNHTANSNNIIFAVMGNGTSGQMMPHFWIQNGASSQASGVSRSFMIVNENVGMQNTTNITSCVNYMAYANQTLRIDCNTTTTGADLLVGDDMQVVGDAYMDNTVINGQLTTQNIRVNGNVSIKRPYAMYSTTATQTATLANTAYDMTLNNTEIEYQIIMSSDRKNISVQQNGTYLVDTSIILDTTAPNKHVEVWVKKNGVNVPRSNTKVEISSATTETVISVPFILDLNTTDFFSLHFASDGTGSRILTTAPTAYSPESPGAIVTITKLSELTQ